MMNSFDKAGWLAGKQFNKSEIVYLIEALSLFLGMLEYNLHFPENWSETMVMDRNFGSGTTSFSCTL